MREQIMQVVMPRAVMPRALAALAVAALWSATGSSAYAKPGFAIVSLSPAAFVSNCQSMGGTSSSAPTGGIRCTLPSGQTVDCSFNTSEGTAACTWTKDVPPAKTKLLIGDPLPSTMNSNPPKPPKANGAPEAPSTVN